ncbi:MAG: LacI family DNA-binding transcriptional regulator [Verrucomicrobiota bacterium]
MATPSHRTLAKMAGVSIFTVSLALRNNPRVAAATRRKIQTLAKRYGYKPNAELAELMARTRATGSTKYQATLAYVDASYPRVRKHYALQAYRSSCRERAEKFGYRLDFF